MARCTISRSTAAVYMIYVDTMPKETAILAGQQDVNKKKKHIFIAIFFGVSILTIIFALEI